MAGSNLTAVSLDDLLLTLNMVNSHNDNSDDFFLLVTGFLVYMMQAGFAFLEAGTVRGKNVTNSLFRNLICSFFACIAYWVFGYALAFGDVSTAYVGYSNWVFHGLPPAKYAFWFFEFTFAAAATSIFSGAIAERADIWSYFIYSVIVGGFIYPVVTHWTWAANGWLLNLQIGTYTGGFQDFAGSGGVHVCGATCALIGCLVLGPRTGRFGAIRQSPGDAADQQMDFRPHSPGLVLLGCYCIFFGFIGFNGGSQLHISQPGDGAVLGQVVVNTFVSGAFGGVSATLIAALAHRRFSLVNCLNGGLTGMVAICAGCNVISTWCAAVTGFVGGIVFFIWALVIPKLKLDDPVETCAIHIGGGCWGLISTALFDPRHGVAFFLDQKSFYALALQAIGFGVIVLWSAIVCLICFPILKVFKCFRVSHEHEMTGLDHSVHKELSYTFHEGNRLSSRNQLIHQTPVEPYYSPKIHY